MNELLLLACIVLPPLTVTVIGRRLERGMEQLDAEARAARCYRLSLVASAAACLQLLAATAVLIALGDTMNWLETFVSATVTLGEMSTPWLSTVLSTATVMLLFGLDLLAFALPSLRLDRINRGNNDAARTQARQSLRATLAGFVPMLVWVGIYAAAPLELATSTVAISLAVTVFLCFSYCTAPLQIALAYASDALPDEHPVAQAAAALCRDAGIRTPAMRVLKFGKSRIANALVSGLLPSFRRIYVSDTMLEDFTAAEIRAILAHEIGHVRRHHLLAYLAISLAATPLLSSAGSLASGIAGEEWTMLIGMVLLMLYWGFGFSFASRIFERQADRYAVEATGDPATLRAALEKLAAVNGTARTRARWDIFNTHPSIDERIRALS